MFGQYNFSVLLGRLNPLFHIQFASWRPATWWEWKEASYGSAVLVLRITSKMTFPCRPSPRYWGKKAQSSVQAGITTCSSVLLIPSPNFVAFHMMDRLDLSQWQIRGVRWCAEFGWWVLSRSYHVPRVAKLSTQPQTTAHKGWQSQTNQADCHAYISSPTQVAHTGLRPNFVLLISKLCQSASHNPSVISPSYYSGTKTAAR